MLISPTRRISPFHIESEMHNNSSALILIQQCNSLITGLWATHTSGHFCWQRCWHSLE